jgi:hypothetical protein
MAIGLDGMISTSDAAEVLGVSESRVRQFVLDGRLKAAGRIGINLLFERRVVAALAKKPRRRGRPRTEGIISKSPIAKTKRGR